MDWKILKEIDDDAEKEDTQAEKRSREKLVEVSTKYDKILKTNREIDQEYAKQEEQLMVDLALVRDKLRECREHKNTDAGSSKTPDFFRYYNVGKPYFKDRSLNAPPDNEDTLLMKTYQMYDFSNVMTVSGWTVGDKNRLQLVLLDMAKEIIRGRINTKINILNRIKHKEVTAKDEMEQLKMELHELRNKKLDNIDMPDSEEFDWEEVASRLNKRHTAQEYKCIWELFFHPKVNKSQWSQKEHELLKKIAAEKGMQDWDAIAAALKTGRTGYQSFVYYRTNVDHASSGRKWSKEEMDSLMKYVNLYRENSYIPWGKIASAMQNRTKIQCYNKYIRMIEIRKGRFLPEEDAVILNFVKTYGPDYRKMATFLSGRSAVQLRCRYNLLQKMRVSATWTVEDDKILLQIMAVQDSRMNFSLATKHFPGKDRQNIRSRYLTLIKWMKANPNSDISCAPRRGARRLLHGEMTPNLVKALDNLKKRIVLENCETQVPKPPKKKSVNRINRMSTDSMITDAILSQIANLEGRKQFNQFVSTVAEQRARVNSYLNPTNQNEISSNPISRANLTNLQQILFLLNTVISNKISFLQSNIGQQFSKLEPKSIVKVKSYSRSAGSDVVELNTKPDLFGTVAGRRRFLLPPNLATVTGSRVLMSLLGKAYNSRERNEYNLILILRKNYFAYENVRKLRERFIDLFTWPYILSNEEPQSREYYENMIDPLGSVESIERPLSVQRRILEDHSVLGQKNSDSKAPCLEFDRAPEMDMIDI